MKQITVNESFKAKDLYNQYLKERNVIKLARKKLVKLKDKYPDTYTNEINFLIHNTELLFNTPLNMYPVIIKQLKNINKEIEYAHYGLTMTTAAQHISLEIKKYFVSIYSKFIEAKQLGGLEIVKHLGIKVCPYCNLNLLNLENPRSIVDGIHFDHFYNRAYYPYFALSFNNLIPCCPTCNSRLKRDIDFYKSKHIHPYIDNFDSSAKFSLKLETPDIYDDEEAFFIELHPATQNKVLREKVINTEKTFRLTERYNARINSVQNILQLHKVYDGNYTKNLCRFLKENGFETFSQDDILDTIYSSTGTINHNINQTPLSKLILDTVGSLSIS